MSFMDDAIQRAKKKLMADMDKQINELLFGKGPPFNMPNCKCTVPIGPFATKKPPGFGMGPTLNDILLQVGSKNVEMPLYNPPDWATYFQPPLIRVRPVRHTWERN